MIDDGDRKLIAQAKNILGITVRELDKLVEIYDLSEKLTNLAEPGASITWARELKNLNRKLLTPNVLDTVIRKINENEITNSKDIRKLRPILKDPIAKHEFVVNAGTIESAFRKVAPDASRKGHGLLGDITQLNEVLSRYPWTSLSEFRGNPQVLQKLDEAEKLLRDLKKALSK